MKKIFFIAIGIAGVILIIFAFFLVRLSTPESYRYPSFLFHEQRVRSSLDGLLKPISEQTKVFGVMIDSHTFGRLHHSGISSASVFFEALAEGGIPRILALFDGPIGSKVGPVRSIRPYFVEMAEPYASALAHIGGSDEALSLIRSADVFDVDGMRYEGIEDYFLRDKKIEMPHNAFVNLSSASRLVKDFQKNFTESLPFFSFNAAPPKGEEAKEILFNFSFPQYRVRYVYDTARSVYSRFLNDESHKDQASGSQLFATNIVALFTDYIPIDDIGRLKMKTVGSGKIFLFRNGVKIEGTWEREQGKPFQFFDVEKRPLTFSPGITWIEVIDNPKRVLSVIASEAKQSLSKRPEIASSLHSSQ